MGKTMHLGHQVYFFKAKYIMTVHCVELVKMNSISELSPIFSLDISTFLHHFVIA